MLVISIDQIPTRPPELFELSKDIPAFVFSALNIGAVWLAHANWSRTFGLQDPITIQLSLGLVILMLVFVYPIKLMAQATVIFITSTLLGFSLFDTGLFENAGWADNTVSGLFVFVALGLMALGSIIIAFYQNSLRFAQELRMTDYERTYCHLVTIAWGVVMGTALLSLLVALLASPGTVPRAGFIYSTQAVTIPLAQTLYRAYLQKKLIAGKLPVDRP